MERLLEVGASTIIVVFLLGAANWAYRTVINRTNEYDADRDFRRMSTGEMIEGLERILSDPKTSAEVRVKAEQQLQTLKARRAE